MEKFTYNRYYTLFGEKGYTVRDSEDPAHKVVFTGKHPNGNDAKKWACEHNSEIKIGELKIQP